MMVDAATYAWAHASRSEVGSPTAQCAGCCSHFRGSGDVVHGSDGEHYSMLYGPRRRYGPLTSDSRYGRTQCVLSAMH